MLIHTLCTLAGRYRAAPVAYLVEEVSLAMLLPSQRVDLNYSLDCVYHINPVCMEGYLILRKNLLVLALADNQIMTLMHSCLADLR